MKTNVAGEGAVRGCDENLLPVAGVAAASHLKMLTKALEVDCPLEESAAGHGQVWTASQPVLLRRGVISQIVEALKRWNGSRGTCHETKHRQGLIQGTGQTLTAEIIRADKSITSIQKDTQSCASRKGRIHTCDRVLLSEETEMIGFFQEDLNQISAG